GTALADWQRETPPLAVSVLSTGRGHVGCGTTIRILREERDYEVQEDMVDSGRPCRRGRTQRCRPWAGPERDVYSPARIPYRPLCPEWHPHCQRIYRLSQAAEHA